MKTDMSEKISQTEKKPLGIRSAARGWGKFKKPIAFKIIINELGQKSNRQEEVCKR